MPQSIRERILAVYRGETPDAVPCMLDLSHWFYQRAGMPWDLDRAYDTPETDLIACHRRLGVGFYLPNLASFFAQAYPEDVTAATRRAACAGRPAITWRLSTPLGQIERTRVWEPRSYSWAVRQWGVREERDLEVLAYALGGRTYTPLWERYQAWADAVGHLGVVYLPLGYSAMGMLLNLWMGVEQTLYAAADRPDALRRVVDHVNANLLDLVDLLCTSPAEVILMGDNFSSDIQPPHFFRRWSLPFYREAIRRLHAAGKHVAMHVDGRLRGALRMVAEAGADCADAVTPAPMGDLDARECREDAGPALILSGGISPELWLPGASLADFRRVAHEWLDMRRANPRVLLAAGDQVPPGAEEQRIEIARDMAEEEGRY